MNDKTQVQLVNEEINRELADPKTGAALLATTFKGLNATLMKQAIMEGMIRGFTFADFLKKDVYALPFKDKNTGLGYSLITSIDKARKIAQKAGQCGKKAPVYTFTDNGRIETCSVTVQKKVDNYIGDYTAEVYFSEYDKKQNLWVSKPRTMIAKVAEMHALRSAFPEELDKIYVEDEMGKESRLNEVKDMVGNNNLSMGNHLKKDEKVTDKTNKKEEGGEEDESDIIPATDHPFNQGGQGKKE